MSRKIAGNKVKEIETVDVENNDELTEDDIEFVKGDETEDIKLEDIIAADYDDDDEEEDDNEEEDDEEFEEDED